MSEDQRVRRTIALRDDEDGMLWRMEHADACSTVDPAIGSPRNGPERIS